MSEKFSLSLTHTHHITTSYPLATPITMQVMCNTGFVQQTTIITLTNFLMLKLEIWLHDLMNNITLIIPPLLLFFTLNPSSHLTLSSSAFFTVGMFPEKRNIIDTLFLSCKIMEIVYQCFFCFTHSF